MTLYNIREDRTRKTTQVVREFEHALGLPGVQCDSCGRKWAAVGPSFPEFELPPDMDRGPYRKPASITSARLAGLIEPVRPLFPPGTPLYPGTAFGPATARLKIVAPMPDFVFFGAWVLLAVSKEAVTALAEAGVRTVEVEVFNRRAPAVVHEVSLPLVGSLEGAVDKSVPPCAVCGWRKVRLPEKLCVRLQRDAEPPALFRTADFPTMLFATDRFVEQVNRKALTGLFVEPVPVVTD